MENLTYNRIKTGLFTEISNRISYDQNSLSKYITTPFSKAAFKEQIKLKSEQFTEIRRTLLVSELNKAYSTAKTDSKVIENIQKLSKPNTFTITTGHQLSLFTGPIYFIYKILHTIKLCEELKLENPSNEFVPVFWMASEDHDFEEIQSVSLFNTNFKWDTDQKGPVGRFNIESLELIITEFKNLFQNHPDCEVIDLLNEYKGSNLGEATFKLVNTLFKSYGLVIIDGDNPNYKKSFSSIIEQELTAHFSYNAVTKTSEQLSEENIKLQITPREINLFFIEENFRARIQQTEDGFLIEGKGSFSKTEMLEILNSNPEKFSPNVVLRPLYQETILPNLCYLGGGGEIAYWLQLKEVFEVSKCVFPLIQVRNSIFIIDSTSQKKMNKMELSIDQLFIDTEELKKQFVLSKSTEELNFDEIDKSFENLEKALKNQAEKIDSNLSSYTNSEITRIEKQLSVIKQKFLKTEKSKHEQYLIQIDQLKSKLFPNGGLQERSINFFSLCSDGNYKIHIATIYNSILPFENDLIIINS